MPSLYDDVVEHTSTLALADHRRAAFFWPKKTCTGGWCGRNTHEIAVVLNIGLAAAEVLQLERIMAQFEDFCLVTQSVRHGLPVNVQVLDRDGQSLMLAV